MHTLSGSATELQRLTRGLRGPPRMQIQIVPTLILYHRPRHPSSSTFPLPYESTGLDFVLCVVCATRAFVFHDTLHLVSVGGVFVLRGNMKLLFPPAVALFASVPTLALFIPPSGPPHHLSGHGNAGPRKPQEHGIIGSASTS